MFSDYDLNTEWHITLLLWSLYSQFTDIKADEVQVYDAEDGGAPPLGSFAKCTKR